jgi:hypothetical protein
MPDVTVTELPELLRGQVLGRQDQHRDVPGRGAGPDPIQHRKAVDVRHHQVQHDPVGPRAGDLIDRSLPAPGHGSPVAGGFDDRSDLDDRRLVVLDDQDPPALFRRTGIVIRGQHGPARGGRCGGPRGKRRAWDRGLPRPFERQIQGKERSLSRGADHRDVPAEHPGSLVGNGQPQSGSLVPPGRGPVHLPELVEDDGEVLRRNADPRVGHPDGDPFGTR